MGRLDGKVAIITGGGSGFGEATALLWAKEGAKVVVADWVAEGGERVAKKIKTDGGEATFVKVDVSKATDAQKMVKTAVDTYGKLDILFNNAGIQGPYRTKVADFEEEVADKIIAINFKGVFLGTKYAIPEMIKSGGGSIISTGSVDAFSGCGAQAVYSATKGAVVAFSQSVATECAKDGIRSNTINPAFGDTPMHAELIKAHPESQKVGANTIPLGRLAKPEDIAYAALFLASDESKFITGANLMVDGGYTISKTFGQWVKDAIEEKLDREEKKVK